MGPPPRRRARRRRQRLRRRTEPLIVPGDYDGDKIVDIATVSPTGQWWTSGSRGSFTFAPPSMAGKPSNWVGRGYAAVPGYYTDPGKTSAAWYREFDAIWFIEGQPPIQFGYPGTLRTGGQQVTDYDVPAPADYDGDGRTDLATFNPATATWRVRESGSGAEWSRVFGVRGTFPMPADYTGDGRADLAVWDFDATWYIDGQVPFTVGNWDCWPTAADFDGDGRAQPSCLEYDTVNRVWTVQGGPTWPVPSDSYLDTPAGLDDSKWANLLIVTYWDKCTEPDC